LADRWDNGFEQAEQPISIAARSSKKQQEELLVHGKSNAIIVSYCGS